MYAGASHYFVGTGRVYIFMPERTAATMETRVPVPGIKFLFSSPCCSVCFMIHPTGGNSHSMQNETTSFVINAVSIQYLKGLGTDLPFILRSL